MKIKLQRVHYMPKELEPGVLYVSEEFETAAHLCACGCGSKIRTPLGPSEWKLEVIDGLPSLSPSVGSWQQACQSHYWIERGEIFWSDKWTPEEIAEGRRKEEVSRQKYYDGLNRRQAGIPQRLWNWVKGIFGR